MELLNYSQKAKKKLLGEPYSKSKILLIKNYVTKSNFTNVSWFVEQIVNQIAQ